MLRSQSVPPEDHQIDELDTPPREYQGIPTDGWRITQQITQAIEMMHSKQNVMEQQANVIVQDLKHVVNTLTCQQVTFNDMLADQKNRQSRAEERQQGMMDQLKSTMKDQEGLYHVAENIHSRQMHQDQRQHGMMQEHKEMQQEMIGQQEGQNRLREETGLAYQRYIELNNRMEQSSTMTDHQIKAHMEQMKMEQKNQEPSRSSHLQESVNAADYNHPMGAGGDDRNLGHPIKEGSTDKRNGGINGVNAGEELRRNSDPGQMITVNSPIRPPPKFTPELYARWKEELSFWREIHSFSSDSNLIAEMALSSSDALRTVLMSFLKDTKEKKECRTFDRLIRVLDIEFQKDSEERALNKLAAFNSFSRPSQEPIRIFWIRFQKMIDECRSCGLELSDKMVFLRGLQALNANEMQRMSIIAAMTYSSNTSCPKVLKTVSTRLMTPMSSNSGKNEELYYESEGMDYGDSEQSIYMAKAKAKNRPGLEQSAIRVSSQQMSFPNMTGGKKADLLVKERGR